MHFFYKTVVAVAGLLWGVGFTFLLFWFLPSFKFDVSDSTLSEIGQSSPEVYGFQPFWLLPKTDENSLDMLTTLSYFSLSMKGDGTLISKINSKEEEPGLTNLKSERLAARLSKARERKLKTSLTVTLFSQTELSLLLKNPEQSALKLLEEITPVLTQYQFSDLNLDIESFREASLEEQQQLAVFLRTVKENLKKTSPQATLSIELTVSSLFSQQLLDPVEIGKVADRVILMAYDFQTRGSYLTGPVAPISGAPDLRLMDIRSSLALAVKKISPEKLLLGVPLYGYSWETISNQPGAPVIPGTGLTVPISQVPELKGQLEGCSDCSFGFDQVAGSPYLILLTPEKSFRHYYFEDVTSIRKKMTLANEFHLGGVALWAVGYQSDQESEVIKAFKNSSYPSK